MNLIISSEPVLTLRLATRFEEVSQLKVYSDRRDGMIQLLAELPDCNRLLVQWVFVHMGHVIANEKMNKMTLQNVSIVLSPTMRISHRFTSSGSLLSLIFDPCLTTAESSTVYSNTMSPSSPT